MNRLPVTVTLAIFSKMPVSEIHRISATFIKYIPARGWHRALNNDRLFYRCFMRIPNMNVELPLWKKVFPEYPTLCGSYAENFRRYITIIEPELAIQDTLDHFAGMEQDHNVHLLILDMREFKTPKVTYSCLQMLLLQIGDPVLFLNNVIQLHNWPDALADDGRGITEHHFWELVCEKIQTMLEHWKHNMIGYNEHIIDVKAFITRYKTHIDWNRNRFLYKCIDEQFLEENQDICSRVNWTTIITSIPLSEGRLAAIMVLANAQQRYYDQNVNVAFIASHQEISEAFIEEYFVGQPYDLDHVWNNLFKKQRLTSAFCEKYSDRKPKPRSYALRQLLEKQNQDL